MQFVKTFRNHPKKSIVGAVLFGYFSKWLNSVHENHLYRHATCQSIKHHGFGPMNFLEPPKKIMVFLNPAASSGKAADLYRKNATPVFHLSGADVQVVRLEREGQAKELMSAMDYTTDMIVCAGGDGTLNEVVTGLMRRPDASHWSKVPIGVLPLGKSNTICHVLSGSASSKKSKTQAQWITESASNLFTGKTTMVDVFKVQSEDGRDAYGLTDFRWGSYRDAQAKQHKYWYFGSLRKYVTYYFRALRGETKEPCQLDLSYNEAIVPEVKASARLGPIKAQPGNFSLQKIISSVLPIPFRSESPKPKEEETNAQDKTGEESVEKKEEFNSSKSDIETVEFMASANHHRLNRSRDKLSMKLTLEEETYDVGTYIKEGPGSVVDGRHRPVKPVLEQECSKFKIVPKNKPDSFFSIDNEEFEAFPCTVELLPNKLKMFYFDS